MGEGLRDGMHVWGTHIPIFTFGLYSVLHQRSCGYFLKKGQALWNWILGGTNNQLHYSLQAYQQINLSALKMWREFPSKGENLVANWDLPDLGRRNVSRLCWLPPSHSWLRSQGPLGWVHIDRTWGPLQGWLNTTLGKYFQPFLLVETRPVVAACGYPALAYIMERHTGRGRHFWFSSVSSFCTGWPK